VGGDKTVAGRKLELWGGIHEERSLGTFKRISWVPGYETPNHLPRHRRVVRPGAKSQGALGISDLGDHFGMAYLRDTPASEAAAP
jgi:hypothetical protein